MFDCCYSIHLVVGAGGGRMRSCFTLDYANNTHSIMHGVERFGDDDVC